MTKDFARKFRKDERNGRGSFYSIIVLVVFTLVVIYFKGYKAVKLVDVQKEPAVKEEVDNKKQEKQAKAKPRFEFYTILPNGEVSKESKDDDVIEETKEIVGNFLVQVAAFRQRKDAQNLVMELKKKEFKSYVNNASNGWFSVQLGPFAIKGVAEGVQKQLSEQNYKSILLNKSSA